MAKATRKERKKAEKALRQIARRDGISVAEVRRHIDEAIDAAMQSPDPGARAFWQGFDGRPDAEDVIARIAGRINDKQ